MLKQTFRVTLTVPSPLDRSFSRDEARRMATVIRDGVEARSAGFMGSTPFTIRVDWADEAASTSGSMLPRRIVPCLGVKHGRAVRRTGAEFGDAGDPVKVASCYCKEGADELVVLDLVASSGEHVPEVGVVERISSEVLVPLAAGGGLRGIGDIERMLRAGADKVVVNSAAVINPGLVAESVAEFGNRCIVVAIDARRVECIEGTWWHVYIHGGQRPTGLDAISWARRASELGAGELLVTSIDADGCPARYDIDLIRTVSEEVTVPVIAGGSAENPADLYRALAAGGADVVLAASFLHDGTHSIGEIKQYLAEQGIPMRL